MSTWVPERDANRILFVGPGVCTAAVITPTEAEAHAKAPAMARAIKAQKNVRWVAWRVHPVR